MSPGVLVRQAVRDEAAGIADVLRQSFAEFEPLYTTEGFAATVVSAEDLIHRIGEGPVWVALWGQTIAGTASAVLKGSVVSTCEESRFARPLAGWELPPLCCEKSRVLQEQRDVAACI